MVATYYTNSDFKKSTSKQTAKIAFLVLFFLVLFFILFTCYKIGKNREIRESNMFYKIMESMRD